MSAAGIPRVEEWKEMKAAYESCSVPLGRFEHNSLPSLQAGFECMNLVGSHQTQGRDDLVSHHSLANLCRFDNVTVTLFAA
jgi:bud emergence protein 1